MGGSFIEALITLWIEMGLPWNSSMPIYITLIGAGLLLPFFLKNIRISQARNLLKRSNSVYGEQRKEMEREAVSKVQDIPHALLGLADQAISMKRYDLVDTIIVDLPDTPKMRREIQRLQHRMHPREHFDWSKAELKIENLLEANLVGAAQAHFDQLPIEVQQSLDARALLERIKSAQ